MAMARIAARAATSVGHGLADEDVVLRGGSLKRPMLYDKPGEFINVEGEQATFIRLWTNSPALALWASGISSGRRPSRRPPGFSEARAIFLAFDSTPSDCAYSAPGRTRP